MNEDRLLAGTRTVHVRITLAPEDNASMNTSLPPVLVNAPFFSTTDALAENSYKCFKPYLPPLMGRASKDVDAWAAAWFTLKGLVVSGRQIPLGVLSSYMAPAAQAPLELMVHFSKAYPSEACPFRASSRSQQHLIFNPRHMYFNSLKEGLCILTGKGQQVPFMMPDAWQAVWSAARQGSLEHQHDSIRNCKSPIDTTPCQRSGRSDTQIPLRLLLCQTPQAGKPLCGERFFSRPATAERRDGSHPTLMDTLYSIYPTLFAPAVACQLSVHGAPPREHVTLLCACQLEVQSTGELLASPQNEHGADAASTSAPAIVQCAQQAVSSRLDGDDTVASTEPPCSDYQSSQEETDPLRGAYCAAQESSRQAQRTKTSEAAGRDAEESCAGAECGATSTGGGARQMHDVAGPAVEAGPGEAAEQLMACTSDVAAAPIPPPGTPIVHRTKSRPQDGRVVGKESSEMGMFPAKVLSGCLHREVEVQVAGVRAQPPGGNRELLQASLLALHELLHAPDMFLYVVVHVPPRLYVL